MKILYAIQGTGNGHLSRARDIIPILQRKGDVDLLISGKQADVHLPFEVKYRFEGMGFIFGKKGGVDMWQTYKEAHFGKFSKEISKLPIHKYDLIISDFEPVSAWACMLKGKQCIGLSHQNAVITKGSPQPKKKDLLGLSLLKYYAPATINYGFHFARFSENMFTPVIRQEVRSQIIKDEGHYSVYLPSYDDETLIASLRQFKDIKWEVFSKHNTKPIREKNVFITPINNEAFLKSMATSSGVLCGAGFETPAEALYLGKKLLVIPMKHQYEQHCNAAALEYMGIPVIKNLKEKHHHKIEKWLDKGKALRINYPDITEDIISSILDRHANSQAMQQVKTTIAPKFQLVGI